MLVMAILTFFSGFGLVLRHINHCRLFHAKSIFIHINSSISNHLVWHKSRTVLFQTIQFSKSTVWMSNSFIPPIDRTLSGATTPGQSEPGSDGNQGVLCFPQSSTINRASSSHCLVSYPGYSLGESYSSVEMQSVNSAAEWGF